MAAEMFGSDAYSPREIAERVENIGVAKARLPLFSQLVLGLLAGVFIGFGAMFFNLVTSDASLGFALGRVLGGSAFALGLVLVVIAGAELFTGNNLLVMAWTNGRISLDELLRNWAVIWVANFIGAAGLALVVVLSNHPAMNDGLVGAQAVKIAAAKTSLPFAEAFFKGLLCNTLVCLAVWLAMAGRTVVDKIARRHHADHRLRGGRLRAQRRQHVLPHRGAGAEERGVGSGGCEHVPAGSRGVCPQSRPGYPGQHRGGRGDGGALLPRRLPAGSPGRRAEPVRTAGRHPLRASPREELAPRAHRS